jgi:hypothetical protein
MVEARIGCVAGAMLVSDTERLVKEAGLVDVVLRPKPGYVEGMVDWQDPLYQQIMAQLPEGTKPADFITSLEITARKAEATGAGDKPSIHVEVYDPAMCCSTGVCGPEVDPKLVRFASDLDWLKSRGVVVQRYNLAQSPAAFAENETVKAALADHGTECLPLVMVDGVVVSVGSYPGRGDLARWSGVVVPELPAFDPLLLRPDPTRNQGGSRCCSPESGCC